VCSVRHFDSRVYVCFHHPVWKYRLLESERKREPMHEIKKGDTRGREGRKEGDLEREERDHATPVCTLSLSLFLSLSLSLACETMQLRHALA
jgi:hypothetical protein